MPQLIDLVGKVTINNLLSKDSKKSLYQLQTILPKEELSFANRLRTTFETNYGKKVNTESDKIFAGWCNELNRSPKTDCFQTGKINTVKQPNEADEMLELEKEINLRQWRDAVNARYEALKADGYKAYKTDSPIDL